MCEDEQLLLAHSSALGSKRIKRSFYLIGVCRMTETVNEAVLNDLVGKVIGDVAGAMSLFMA